MENPDFLTTLLNILPPGLRQWGAAALLATFIFVTTRSYKKPPAPASVADKAINAAPVAPIVAPCNVNKAAFDALSVVVAEMHAASRRSEARALEIESDVRRVVHMLERLEDQVGDVGNAMERCRRSQL